MTEQTIDWSEFWREADADERETAEASTSHARDVLSGFIEETGVPNALADVGCGTGVVAFHVAEQYPGTTVVGYDAAESVLVENRERADTRDRDDVRFEHTVLPEFDPGRQFDVVFCYATLGYVAEAERALRNLYDAVAPDGHLVFSYPNRLASAHYRRVVESEPTEADFAGSGFDPDRYAERFRLVVESMNLLSYEHIHEVLGTWPRSVFSVVERPDVRYAWRQHPLVYVPK